MTDLHVRVHTLQILLERAGYGVDEDELRWWQFGSTTANALSTFQACEGLPETGVSDARTWRRLMGSENARPEDITNVCSGDSNDEDLEDMTGRVWLLGEQRWARA